MEFLKQVFDLPVLVQGAFGSLLFWLAFEVTKITFNMGVALLSKASSNIKRELKSAEALNHAHNLFGLSTMSIALHMTSLFVAVNRIIRALIYLCIGLISESVLGPISSVAYLISIGYLFLALRTVQIDFESRTSKTEQREEFKKLANELIEESEKKGKVSDNPA